MDKVVDHLADERLRQRGWEVSESGCWVIGGYRCSNGYGYIRVRSKRYQAHRAAYIAWVGAIPEKHLVRHLCDNPPCINPGHLLTGTHKDNSRDMVDRGRGQAGEKHWNARLTFDDVVSIRSRYAKGGVYHRQLAEEYKVSRVTVTRILTNSLWPAIMD